MTSTAATLMLDNTEIFCGWAILISNLALKAGSSKQGKAVRANTGSNMVTASSL